MAVTALRLAAVAAVAVALTGCTGGPPPSEHRNAVPDGSTAVPVGMYGLDGLELVEDGAKTVFSAPTSCDVLIDTIAAGQWRADVVLEPISILHLYWAALAREDERAFLQLVDAPYRCDATIVRESQQHVRLAGAAEAEGEARLVAFACQSVNFDPSEKELAVVLLYDLADDLHLSIQAGFTGFLGESTVTMDDAGVWLSTGSGPLLDQYVALWPPISEFDDFNDMNPTPPGRPFQPADEYEAGTVTITDEEVYTGTLSLHGLRDTAGRTLDVDADFRCTP
jgi:hypothetical protein